MSNVGELNVVLALGVAVLNESVRGTLNERRSQGHYSSTYQNVKDLVERIPHSQWYAPMRYAYINLSSCPRVRIYCDAEQVCRYENSSFFMAIVTASLPVVKRSKASVCGHSLPGIAGSNPAGGSVVCFQVRVSVSG